MEVAAPSGYEEKAIELRALEALGKGFDLTSDFRLKYVKGCGGERLVVLDEGSKRDILIPGGGTIRGVYEDIRCDKGDRIRFRSDVLEFNQMSELLNQKSSLQGKVPSGYLNAIFEMSGDWLQDAADTKYLALDGYFISLYYLHLTSSPLVLQEKVKKKVPPRWDPASLARFIQTYGTHIIVGMAVGGQDLVCVKQRYTSPISPADLRRNLQDVGDILFSDGNSSSLLQRTARDGKHKVPDIFNRILQSNTLQLSSITETSSKDGLTIICSKRGGDVFLHTHSKWLQTVPAKPEAILFKFVPITSLLTGVPGSGYLSHAINLYLRYKPGPEDLQYFLEFQVPRQWAPTFCELPLRHQRRKTSCPSLQFSFMGPKIYVSSTQVTSNLKPVVGLRLYLEGKKCNRLALHLQHLSSPPHVMTSAPANIAIDKPPRWQGSDEFDSSGQFMEPIRWKSYSKVCTSAVMYDPNWMEGESSGVFVVTGAQLLSKGSWPKTMLHLRLLFSYIPNCTIRKTEWATAPQSAHKSGFLANISTTFTFTQKSFAGADKRAPAQLNSGVYPDGPPVPVRNGKLLKYVDTAEVLKGPEDSPGHWLVIGAKLVTDGGKIGLNVKFALLDYP
ncbi:MACPF domain-containing protein At1g14780 [Eucalyptus grandis]|uniref:MACPF domain-containing protein At1g14780 n=1 Tax=Eucalyptus grandis TaxID=71139 RepID=UPI00192ECE5F|nr:MACPF domain-containing protein At1g14780 [Eucalyptus grandis]XP_039155010.1 MACPF domain-containing protein At1g14780 [Eucalyptus grandis]